ncbi:uncharacterized protein LOC123514551 isoform X2 [Portunus trituberculatus]|uniref:uncharacterized protein LOC123514551 isoform X2 n=1 Tax=Portunus trituberculatus TaxID=210409 RepID=UPI001E1D0146|nr:uncharacterized protein LOC123514551 isoform X2 [Portunus trituberculatus]
MVRFTGVYGQKRVTAYAPEPDLCRRCSRWGHKAWRCRAAHPRCRYCAASHDSDVCFQKISQSLKFPPKCCNCLGSHNAQSGHCPYKPRSPGATHGQPSVGEATDRTLSLLFSGAKNLPNGNATETMETTTTTTTTSSSSSSSSSSPHLQQLLLTPHGTLARPPWMHRPAQVRCVGQWGVWV